MKPLSWDNPYFEVVLSSKAPMSVGLCAPRPEFEQHPPKRHVGKFQQSVGFWTHNGSVWIGSEHVPYHTEIRCQPGDVVRIGGVFSASGEFGNAVYFAYNGDIFGEFTVLLDEKALCPTIVMTEPKAEMELRFPKPQEETSGGIARPSRGTTSSNRVNRSTLSRRTVRKSEKELQDIMDAHEAAIRAEQEELRESMEEAELRQRKEKAADFKSNFAEAMDAVHNMQSAADEGEVENYASLSMKMLHDARQKEKFAAIRRCSLTNSVKYGLSPFVHRKSLQQYEAFVPDFNFELNQTEEEPTNTKVLDKQAVVALVNRKSLEPHALAAALDMLLNPPMPPGRKEEATPESVDDNSAFHENVGAGPQTSRSLGSRNPSKGQPVQPETSASLPQISPNRGSIGKLVTGKRAVDSAVNTGPQSSLTKPGAIKRNPPPQRSILARAAEGALTHR